MTEPTDRASQTNSSQKLDLKKKAVPRAQRGREAKIQKLGKQAISTLFLLVRNVKMHDADNAIFAQPLENLRQCINTIVAIDGQFQLNAIGTTIYINGKQLKLDFSALDNVRYLTDQFQEKDVGGFDVKHPVQTQELKDFIWIFGAANEADCNEAKSRSKEICAYGVRASGLLHEEICRTSTIGRANSFHAAGSTVGARFS
jgi:hypothetical protein